MSTPADNKTLVLQALDALMVRKDASAVDRYFAEPYRQHNPLSPNGLPALKGLVQGLSKNPGFKYERFRAVAAGDLVAVHGRYTGFLPQPAMALDLFRVEDGRIVEHWDGLQVEAGPNPSGRSMGDGPREPADLGRRDANGALVREFLEAVLVRGELRKLPGFFAGDAYLQHNPQVGDGLSGLGAFLGALQQQGVTMHYAKVHRVVAEGDLVVTQSEGTFGGKPQAFYDLFRVANGKIAEHWDVIQEVPARTASGLGMF